MISQDAIAEYRGASEFRPGGLYPFLRLAQTELADTTCPLDVLDPALDRALENAPCAQGGSTSWSILLTGFFCPGWSATRRARASRAYLK